MGTVTNVLNQDSLQAAFQDQSLQVKLYQELKIIARAKRAQGDQNEAINTTALVHETYLRLNQHGAAGKWHSRRHFYATAALAMKQILIDQARMKLAEKRGGNQVQVTWQEDQFELVDGCHQLVALGEALERLYEVDPQMVELVHLKYFVGLSMSELVEILETPKRTLERRWRAAKAVLQSWVEI